MHEWMVDNGLTPHLVVDARREGVLVPSEHVQDGKVVINVSPAATRGLTLGNEIVTFEARFGGVSRPLQIPMDAVLGIYARETGQGMIFGDNDSPPSPEGEPPPSPEGGPPVVPAGDGRRPKLTVVK